jgi:hypothetical protein
MIPILIAVAWLNVVTIVVAACRVAARGDAIELKISHRAGRAVGEQRGASCGESLNYGVRVVVRGHQSTLRRIS